MDYKDLADRLDNHGPYSTEECARAVTDLLARCEAAEKIVDEYAASARAIALWLNAFCDKSLSYPSMISNAARKVSFAYADMEARAEKAEKERDAAQAIIAQDIGVTGVHAIKTCFGCPLEKVQELVEADREGRCVVLPCKVGDTVYVTGRKKIVEATVQEIYLDDSNGMEMLVHFKCDTSCSGCPFNSLRQDWDGEWSCDGEYGDGCVFQREFGKTVFLTREAAEAALKGENGG